MLTTYDLDIQTRPRFSPIYTTAKLKADTCNSFQVIMQTDRQTHTHTHTALPNGNLSPVQFNSVFQCALNCEQSQNTSEDF